ncbi:hypothetical protein ANN_25148 [Periplaneta americana]|uniref:Reverse transcriptase domain-containing protein n=1 Tax=Periplaneta americana TaxID=6978 RepID=A0ABQ8S132_PERAM|nr:hypothetical protein ANN_25148 [Periplaneta americana]
MAGLCEGGNEPPGSLNAILTVKRVLKEPCIIPPLQQDGCQYASDNEKCEIFADTSQASFIPNPIKNKEFNEEIELFPNNYPSAPLPVNFTSPNEIHSIIQKLPTKKSPGYDLIPNFVLKYLTRKALANLASLFNALLRLEYFPDTWKHAVIIVIHKPGKPASNPTSYCPISLLSTISKVFEKVLLKRLDTFLLQASILPPYQFGFRRNHSTNHQGLRITEQIAQGFENKEQTAVSFLDFTQAFDRVWHKGLRYKLHKSGVPDYLCNIMTSFLSNRTFSVRVGCTHSSVRPISAGVPQGSILGPILFNVYTSDIPATPTAQIAMYADDTAIYATHHNINIASNHLQEALNIICPWIENWRIALNYNKCEAMIFTLCRPANPPCINLSTNVIPWKPKDEAVKYLGVHLDRRLSWKHHINNKLKLAYSRLAKLYPLLNKKSSLKLQNCMLLYRSLLRPLLLYACPVWGGAAISEIKHIQSFQNKVLRISLNSPWFVRNSQLHRETGIDTIKQFIHSQAKKFYDNLENVPGAVHYSLGKKSTFPTRIKSQLPMDLIL